MGQRTCHTYCGFSDVTLKQPSSNPLCGDDVLGKSNTVLSCPSRECSPGSGYGSASTAGSTSTRHNDQPAVVIDDHVPLTSPHASTCSCMRRPTSTAAGRTGVATTSHYKYTPPPLTIANQSRQASKTKRLSTLEQLLTGRPSAKHGWQCESAVTTVSQSHQPLEISVGCQSDLRSQLTFLAAEVKQIKTVLMGKTSD